MNEHDGPKPPEGSGQENSGAGPNQDGNSGQYNQRIEHAPVTARVPERVARGVFSTGVIIIDGPYEFVLDFVMGLVQPRQVVARVILTPVVVEPPFWIPLLAYVVTTTPRVPHVAGTVPARVVVLYGAREAVLPL